MYIYIICNIYYVHVRGGGGVFVRVCKSVNQWSICCNSGLVSG